jgi:hypothetical protein
MQPAYLAAAVVSEPQAERWIAMKFALRTVALIIGVVGFLVGLVVNFAYSTFHFIGDMMGADVRQSHGVIGFLVLVVGLIGALIAPFSAVVSGVVMLVVAIALFFILHWAALLVSPFFIVAAILVFLDRPAARAA